MLQAKIFESGQVQLHYVEGPANGLPLVLLHGGSARWQAWEPLLPNLLVRYHVFALDLRGHGQSGWYAPYTLQSYAADIAPFLFECVGKPAVLYGHSLGGMISLLVAAGSTSVVRGVIVGDSPLQAQSWINTLQATRPRLVEWHALASSGVSASEISEALKQSPVELPGQTEPLPAQEVFGENSPWFDWMGTNLAQLDPATLDILIEDAASAAQGYELEKVFPTIGSPIVLLQADPSEGALMLDEEVAKAKRLVPNLQHRKLQGVDHALHSTHPALVGDVLLEYVQLIERETA